MAEWGAATEQAPRPAHRAPRRHWRTFTPAERGEVFRVCAALAAMEPQPSTPEAQRTVCERFGVRFSGACRDNFLFWCWAPARRPELRAARWEEQAPPEAERAAVTAYVAALVARGPVRRGEVRAEVARQFGVRCADDAFDRWYLRGQVEQVGNGWVRLRRAPAPQVEPEPDPIRERWERERAALLAARGKEESATGAADPRAVLAQVQEGQAVALPLLATVARRIFPTLHQEEREELAARALELHRGGAG